MNINNYYICRNYYFMDFRELRAGNWVSHLYKNHRSEGSNWGDNIISAKDIGFCEQYPNNYKPITLTEEWLLKFGFEISENAGIGGRYYEKNIDTFSIKYSIYNRIDYNAIYFILEGDGYYDYKGELDLKNSVQYVHQLQNVYFALTQTELTLK